MDPESIRETFALSGPGCVVPGERSGHRSCDVSGGCKYCSYLDF
jgi:hypothetical protein